MPSARQPSTAADQATTQPASVRDDVLRLLDEVCGLGGRAATFTDDTPLLANLPELDSMAVIALITALEERLGVVIDHGAIDGDTFASVGSLVQFVQAGRPG
jgi:acyl carrier protein